MTGYLTIEAAATFTAYTRGYLYNLIHANKIPFIKCGRKIWFHQEELRRWVRDGGANSYDPRKFKRERY